MNKGYAVKVGEELTLRTASDTPEAAMINALVLYLGVNPYTTGDWTEKEIHEVWAMKTAKLCDCHQMSVVAVELVETKVQQGEVN